MFLSYSAGVAQADSAKANRDSAAAVPIIDPNFSSPFPTIKVTEGFHSTKSSLLAVGLSAVVPGVGQIYNEDYWKAPVIWTLGGYWVYEWIQNNKKYRDFGDQYSASITPQFPLGNEKYLQLRDFYRDQRDKFSWYMGALYFLNLLDAYVGANLYDFNVAPDLSADGKIVPRVTVSLRWKF